MAEQRKNEMNNEIVKLERECGELQTSVDGLEKSIQDMEKSFTDDRDKLEKKHKETVEMEKAKNQLLKEELQKLLSAQSQGGQDKGKKK